MQSTHALVVVLGTGGTIAGTSATADDSQGYTAAQIGVEQLLGAVPTLAGTPLESEQVAQIDSKDMEHAVWRALADRIAHHLAREEVAGIVVTHGTDTLEETAYLLQRVLAPQKPVVLTAAMRPATSHEADGPKNLQDAVTVARSADAHGVVVVMAGQVHAARDVRKLHTTRIDAFDSGQAGPLAAVDGGTVNALRDWPNDEPWPVRWPQASWPRVVIVMSHAGADGLLVDAAVAQGARGIVVAGTGNGTLHHALEAALQRAQNAGVRVIRCSRVATGSVSSKPDELFPAGGDLSPVKTRIELMLQLMRAG
jgi:L-asparaginase